MGKRTVLVTGGYGFIGAHFIQHWATTYPSDTIINLDSVTYAVHPLARKLADAYSNHVYFQLGTHGTENLETLLRHHNPEIIVHLAAESHVCRSIDLPELFYRTNTLGTYQLMSAFNNLQNGGLFHYVSTDEVFGQLSTDPVMKFNEHSPIDPRSPYSASKAAPHLFLKAFHETFGLRYKITCCSNNYGPFQHKEKLIPRTISRLLKGKPAELYQSGKQVRDWIHVEDHARAIEHVINESKDSLYLVGANTEKTNEEIVTMIGKYLMKKNRIATFDLIHSNARPTDDFRYAIDNHKLRSSGFAFLNRFQEGLECTVDWYLGPGRPYIE